MIKYKGFEYLFSVEEESDNKKILHDVKTPEGVIKMFDWSPYAVMTEEDFKLWVDLGCPKRIGTGPLNREDLLKMEKVKNEFYGND